MSWAVPLSDVRLAEDEVQAVIECLRSGWLTMGPRTAALEAALAESTGAEHVVAVSSGTAALHLACRAAGLGPGDQMIVPPLTFIASAAAARYCGAEPVLCDVRSPHEPNLDPADVERRITPRTRAVMAVHFGGYPADVLALRALCDERDLILIENTAQAIGARVGDGDMQAGIVGHIGCLSFFSKTQLCLGEGGAVLTADAQLARSVRSLRSHAMTSGTWDRHRGHKDAYDVIDVGYNYRLDEPRAALGLARLPRLAADLAARRAVVQTYRERLRELPGLELAWNDRAVRLSSHFAFFVLLEDHAARDAFRAELADRGVQTTWYPALHKFTEYRGLAEWGSLPHAEAASDRHCVLPLSPTMDDATLDTVVSAVRGALGA